MWYVVQTLAGKEESARKAICQAVAAEERQRKAGLCPDSQLGCEGAGAEKGETPYGVSDSFHEKSLLETCFVPRYRAMKKRNGQLQEVMETLFPGYLIAVTNRVDDLAACIRSHVRSARLIGGQDEAFVPLNREEVAWIDAFTHCGTQAIGVSTAVVSAGDKVEVIEGPLMGREGWISSVNHPQEGGVSGNHRVRPNHSRTGRHTSGAQALGRRPAQAPSRRCKAPDT